MLSSATSGADRDQNDETLDAAPPDPLFTSLKVVNIGLESFAHDLAATGAAVAHVSWAPPATADARLGRSLSLMFNEPRIEAANREALNRLLRAEPWLIDVRPAGQLIPELTSGRLVLHAGPPITWERMCGPMRGAVCGAAVFEGWARDLASAERMAASGEFDFQPNHKFGAVGPMTGITTRSMALMVVENRASGNVAYSTINEGLGKVMRFGGNDSEVLGRLAWLRDALGPALGAALRAQGGIPLKALVARGLTMGDELHQRNVACTSLFLREIAPSLAQTARGTRALAQALSFIGGNDQFFLNVAMAMGKTMGDSIQNMANCSLVSAMSRNGTDFGIKVSGLGDRWFTAPVEMPEGLYFPGFSAADANPDMGDSTIVETVGLGGFAMAASPAVVGFVGAGSASSAATFTSAMREITAGENPGWAIPAMDFAGVPTGIDVRLVAEANVAPIINTGIAHKEPGVGQVGAGVVRAPIACFVQAARTLAEELRIS